LARGEIRARPPGGGPLRALYDEDMVRELAEKRSRREAGLRDERERRLRELAENPANREDPPAPASAPVSDERSRARDEALRTVERYVGSELRSEAADRLDWVLREQDPMGVGARYVKAVGEPAYNSAFGKLIQDPAQGHLRFTPQEVTAVQKVSRVMSERALAEGSDTTGGFAVPFVLDPTIMLSSNGALNPYRLISRVIPITTHEWRGVSSDGITANYTVEATEASDDAPAIAQPTAKADKAQAFVPFSIEVGQDWMSLQAELARLLADAKDVLEATKFTTGSGTNEPAGVLTGLTTTQRVQTAALATFASVTATCSRRRSGAVSAERLDRRQSVVLRRRVPAGRRGLDGARRDPDPRGTVARLSEVRGERDDLRDHDRDEDRGGRRLSRRLCDRRSDRTANRSDPALVRRQPQAYRPKGCVRVLALGFEGRKPECSPVFGGQVMAAQTVKAKTTFQTTVKGTEHYVHEGDELPATHPVVKARRELFNPLRDKPSSEPLTDPIGRPALQTSKDAFFSADRGLTSSSIATTMGHARYQEASGHNPPLLVQGPPRSRIPDGSRGIDCSHNCRSGCGHLRRWSSKRQVVLARRRVREASLVEGWLHPRLLRERARTPGLLAPGIAGAVPREHIPGAGILGASDQQGWGCGALRHDVMR